MKNPRKDDQLLFEHGDLDQAGKHWLPDLELLERNLEVLQKVYGKPFFQLLKEKETKIITKILTKVSEISAKRLKLKTDIKQHIKKLEPLITNPEQNFDISVSNTHLALERRMSDVFIEYNSVKNNVWDFAKWSLKGEYLDKHLLSKHLIDKPGF